MMKQFLVLLPTILVVIPFIVTVALYQLLYYIYRMKWKAIHLTVQSTALLYVVAVTILLCDIIGISVISYVIIFILVLLGTILIIQWKKDIEVNMLAGLKVALRIIFLLFLISYIGLLIYLSVKIILAGS